MKQNVETITKKYYKYYMTVTRAELISWARFAICVVFFMNLWVSIAMIIFRNQPTINEIGVLLLSFNLIGMFTLVVFSFCLKKYNIKEKKE